MTECCCCGCIEQDQVGIIERCGAFHSEGAPGFICLPIPGIYVLRAAVSFRMRQLNVRCETKSKDDVFVHVVVGIQFKVIEEKARDAFYRMSNPDGQISSFVYDVVRSSVPKMDLDELFVNKQIVATDIKHQLTDRMQTYGYQIHRALVIDISPATVVQHGMNEINVNKRLRMAAFEKAEAHKLAKVIRAEGEAEGKFLQGYGIARQRAAIVQGLRDSVGDFTDTIPDLSAKDVLELVLMTQHFDTLSHIADRRPNTIYMAHNPGAMLDICKEMRSNFA